MNVTDGQHCTDLNIIICTQIKCLHQLSVFILTLVHQDSQQHNVISDYLCSETEIYLLEFYQFHFFKCTPGRLIYFDF